MKKIAVILSVASLLLLSACTAEGERYEKDRESSLYGLNRTVEVYAESGQLIRTYKGKIDIGATDNGNGIKFELDGKRINVYNGIVIVEEK